MRKNLFLIPLFLVFLISCDKKNDEKWPEADKAYHDNVIALQESAAQNYQDWILTMDSLDAIQQLQAFFLADPSVVTAEIGSQGIVVQYSNGMRGGIFINPEDEFATDSTVSEPVLKNISSDPGEKSLVNNKKAVFLNPSYWERMEEANNVISNYNQNLPKAGFVLQNIYKNAEASVDRFTQLTGYGLIHIYSHGLAWPDKNNLQEVYLLTGESVNEATSWKYWAEILNGNIILLENLIAANTWGNVYCLREKFIEGHNDFSQDTTLFYAGFCFSHLGTWPDLEQTFGNGAYFGYNWRVETRWNCKMAKSLVGCLTDTLLSPSGTSENWWSNPVPKKYRWDVEDERYCHLLYTGDPGLKLLKDPDLYYGKRYGGGIIFYIDEQKKHGLIMAETDQSTGAPFGCFETLIGGTNYEFGYGQANTTLIVNGCSEAGTAARICDELVLNGYSDWYLPSGKELDYMYYASDDFGNFYKGYYFSSAEIGWNQSWALDFASGSMGNLFKNELCRVRAIRAF